ncbi:Fic family protein [Streptomyces sp. NPDC001594]|uniref:Fic family protein n=1 Tax=Streptomyces sp. NPDC001594 TaxID=3364590 RepID=UPI0036829B1C
MPWTEAVSYALEDHYGRWSLGWRWAHGEGDFDGGPVGSWCCFRHSVTTPEETLDRVAEGLCEWREWLETLSRWFEAYPLDLDGIEDQRVLWECAARNLIFQVVDRTGCASGWYGHCAQVLTWFLTRWGVAPDLAHDLVDEAIGGRFHSWTHPRPLLVDEVAERLPRTLRPGDRARPAFAKHGRERYGIAPGTPARFDACLAESTRGAGEAPLPLPARAVRAYLDVCFFHPFDDGNARCAFLALVFVLAREGAALDSVGFLRRLTCRADAPEDAEHLAAYLARRLADSPR